MKKEVFLAITIGFVLGLVITFGVWTANKSLKDLPSIVTTPSSTPPVITDSTSPAPTLVPNQASSTLIISSPENELLTDQKSVTVTGKFLPNSVISVVAETGQQMITTDSTGAFSAPVTLEGGYNYITVTAFDAKGVSQSQKLVVTYSTTKI